MSRYEVCHVGKAGLPAKGVWAGIYGENWKVYGLA